MPPLWDSTAGIWQYSFLSIYRLRQRIDTYTWGDTFTDNINHFLQVIIYVHQDHAGIVKQWYNMKKVTDKHKMCRKRNRLSERKGKISTRICKSHQDIAMWITIFQDTLDSDEVMEARPPSSPVLLFFLTAKPGNKTAAPSWPNPHHTSKSVMRPRNSSASLLVNSHNERDGVSDHQRLDCLLNRLFMRRHQRKYQSSASLACVWGIHRWTVNSLHKRLVSRKMFPFDEVIMPLAHCFQ